jgi:hypothetical protein
VVITEALISTAFAGCTCCTRSTPISQSSCSSETFEMAAPPSAYKDREFIGVIGDEVCL